MRGQGRLDAGVWAWGRGHLGVCSIGKRTKRIVKVGIFYVVSFETKIINQGSNDNLTTSQPHQRNGWTQPNVTEPGMSWALREHWSVNQIFFLVSFAFFHQLYMKFLEVGTYYILQLRIQVHISGRYNWFSSDLLWLPIVVLIVCSELICFAWIRHTS